MKKKKATPISIADIEGFGDNAFIAMFTFILLALGMSVIGSMGFFQKEAAWGFIFGYICVLILLIILVRSLIHIVKVFRTRRCLETEPDQSIATAEYTPEQLEKLNEWVKE